MLTALAQHKRQRGGAMVTVTPKTALVSIYRLVFAESTTNFKDFLD